MRIARLCSSFNENIEGGLDPNIYYLSKEQAVTGNKVIVFALSDKEKKQKRIAGVDFFWVKKPKKPRVFGGPSLFNALKKSFFKAEVVHGLQLIPFGWLFPFIRKKLNTKYVLSIHNSVSPQKNSIDRTISNKINSFEYSLLSRFLAKRVDLVCAVSKFIADDLTKAGTPKEKIRVIPSGVDFELFNKPMKIKKSKQFTLLYVGRFVKNKNLQYLIKAMNLLKNENIKLLMVGGKKEDNDYNNVTALIKKFGLEKHIKLVKTVPYKKLPVYYHLADAFIFPSVTEGLGKVVWEAMASNTVVVTSKQDGLKEHLTNFKNCIFIPRNNEKEVAEKIKLLQNDKQLQKKLQKNGLKIAKRFDWKNIAKQYTKAFEEIL